MFASPYRGCLAALTLAAGIAGCAGHETGSSGPIPVAIQPAVHQNHRGSWMKTEGKSQTLLYISDTVNHDVNVYTYPGLKYAGQLTGFSFPEGECADKAGNVWITDGGGAVYEYAHGGTNPIATLTSNMYVPQGCAVDPKTGNLAVANGNVEVLVFQGGTGFLTIYRDFNYSQTTSLAYDDHSNLFAVGSDQSTFFHYAELPAGGEAFTDITLNGFPTMQGSGGVQWDGTYMVVGDSQQTLYRVQGSNVVGATALTATCAFAFDIIASKGTVIAPDQCGSNLVGVYPYPAGGSPIKAVTSGMTTPFGVALSK